MANNIVPSMKGKNVRFVTFQNNQKRNVDVKSFSVKPNVTKHADGVCGEDRDRLSNTLNYYEGSFQAYVKDLVVLNSYLENQAALDANTAPLDQKAALRFGINNGTKASYALVGMILDDFDLNVAGKAENVMITQNFRATDMKQVGTV